MPYFLPGTSIDVSTLPTNVAAALGINTLGETPTSSVGNLSSTASGDGADPYDAWFNSKAGQAWNTAQEAAAAQARKVADADMANKQTELKQQAQRIAIEKGTAAANAWYQQQEAKLAQARLDQEWKIQQQNYGLDVAKAYTQYASGPDTMFMLNDFNTAMGRVGSGQGAGSYGAGATPTPRSYDQFAQLAGVGNTSGYGYTPPTGSSPPAGGGTVAQAGGGTVGPSGSTTDPRITAATAVMKAIPPTDGFGQDPSTQAALQAVQNIYSAKAPGTSGALASRPGLVAGTSAGLSRLGYYAPDAMKEIQSWNPSQGNPLAA